MSIWIPTFASWRNSISFQELITISLYNFSISEKVAWVYSIWSSSFKCTWADPASGFDFILQVGVVSATQLSCAFGVQNKTSTLISAIVKAAQCICGPCYHNANLFLFVASLLFISHFIFHSPLTDFFSFTAKAAEHKRSPAQHVKVSGYFGCFPCLFTNSLARANNLRWNFSTTLVGS